MWTVKKFSYIYKITNQVTSEYYIGLRSCDCEPNEDVYYGSGDRIKACIKKYGKTIFEKTILKIFETREAASKYEQEVVNEELIKNKLCLNIRVGGEYLDGTNCTEEIKKKISVSVKKYFENPENRKKTSDSIKKTYVSNLEYGKKISDVQKKLYELGESNLIKFSIWGDEEKKAEHLKKLHSKEVKDKRAVSVKKYANTIEGKKQKSEATKGTIYINKSGVTKRVKENLLNEYLEHGWVLGKSKTK